MQSKPGRLTLARSASHAAQMALLPAGGLSGTPISARAVSAALCTLQSTEHVRALSSHPQSALLALLKGRLRACQIATWQACMLLTSAALLRFCPGHAYVCRQAGVCSRAGWLAPVHIQRMLELPALQCWAPAGT